VLLYKPYSEWLGLIGEEGRSKLRKARGSRMQALNPGFPNCLRKEGTPAELKYLSKRRKRNQLGLRE